jgi:preprotein translocase subunit SecG
MIFQIALLRRVAFTVVVLFVALAIALNTADDEQQTAHSKSLRPLYEV